MIVNAENYARAERFLSWNRERYVTNADIQHHWIGGEDRFWYLRTNAAGEREFVVVDAASGKRSCAFDHAAVAVALTKATGATVVPGALPFSHFRYLRHHSAIECKLDGKVWTCFLDTSTCEIAGEVSAAHELLSHDGKCAAFRKGEDLWIRPTMDGPEFALTTDGVEHFAYANAPGYNTHAVTDTRQGKVAAPQALWSPDSRLLLSYRLDERQVDDAFLLQSVPEDGSIRPKLYKFRYALPGDAHVPVLKPVVFNLETRRMVTLATHPLTCLVLTPFENREMWWSQNSDAIYYIDRDRFAHSASLFRADPHTGEVTLLVQELSNTVSLCNALTVFYFPTVRCLRNGDVIWYSARDGWGHLYYYDGRGALKNQITKGNWVVRNIVRVDEADRRIFFTASGRESGREPYSQYLYSIHFDGSDLNLLTPEDGDHAWPHLEARWPPQGSHAEEERQQFSPSGRYFIESYSRPDRPPTFVLRTSDGTLIETLEEADISRLTCGGYVPVEPFSALAADGNTLIYGNLYRPSTFDPAKSYPVIDAIYPGPQDIRTGKNFTTSLFSAVEAQSLAELGFIVVTIDGRGTPNRSKAFLDHSYGRMGRASDLDDHIAGLQQLASRYPYIDLSRVGIDGVSGGGFAAAYGLLKHPEFFKVAVSAEGNHDQRGYLNCWGETYNGPLESGDYEASATPPLAANLRGKLFLMHGELDDNVLPSLTMKLVDALVKENRDFDLLILPNANHLAFANSPYFIRRKWDYFVRHLLGAEPPPNYFISLPKSQEI